MGMPQKRIGIDRLHSLLFLHRFQDVEPSLHDKMSPRWFPPARRHGYGLPDRLNGTGYHSLGLGGKVQSGVPENKAAYRPSEIRV